jgi:HK97 family phage major capsid protein
MTTDAVTLREAEVTGANAYWVGEGQRKQTDQPTMEQLAWTITSAEIAVIIPMDENVVDDASVDLWELYRPAVETAVANKLDAAAIFGNDRPTKWGAANTGVSIVPEAQTVGNDFEEDATPTDQELLDLISGTGATPATPDGALEALEADLYDPSRILAYNRFKSRLRNLKDADSRYYFQGANGLPTVPSELFSIPLEFISHEKASAIWQASEAHLIMGDWAQAILGTRQGLTYKVFDQGVITDGAGQVLYSLMEQDMVAVRVVARYAFKIITDETADGDTLEAGDDYPFAIVRPYTA